jgi:hypothetical protein
VTSCLLYQPFIPVIIFIRQQKVSTCVIELLSARNYNFKSSKLWPPNCCSKAAPTRIQDMSCPASSTGSCDRRSDAYAPRGVAHTEDITASFASSWAVSEASVERPSGFWPPRLKTAITCTIVGAAFSLCKGVNSFPFGASGSQNED